MLRPEVHHTFLKHKKTDSLYALNYSYVLSDNVHFVFPLGDNTSLSLLYMWNSCSYITALQQKTPTNTNQQSKQKKSPQKNTRKPTKNHRHTH